MARAHDGLMMLLMVGRNHTLRFVVFCIGWLSLMNIVIYFMLDGCNMYVMVSFTLWHLHHGLDKDEVFYIEKCILTLHVYYSFM